MHVLNTSIKPNPYLNRLTKGAQSLNWWPALWARCLFNWFLSALLILFTYSPFLLVTVNYVAGWPIVAVVAVLPLVLVAAAGVRLTLGEAQSEQLTFLRLTPLSEVILLRTLSLAAVYRIRRWLALLVGLCPFLVWVICWLPLVNQISYNPMCIVSPLGNTYCGIDATVVTSDHVLWHTLWCLSITLSLIGLNVCAMFGAVALTLKTKSALNAAVTVLMITVPIALYIALAVAPEGQFLIISTQWNAYFGVWLIVAVIIALLPFAAALGIEYLVGQMRFE